ncbi:MAG: monovalent cation/H(+) antiporter subunit G [Acetobacterales bacterium]
MISVAVDVLSWISILAGTAFLLVGGIGILRMPDFYTRCHAAGVTDTGATLLIVLGLMLQAGWSVVAVKLALVLAFLFFTSPTATHAVSHAAYGSGLRPPGSPEASPADEEVER